MTVRREQMTHDGWTRDVERDLLTLLVDRSLGLHRHVISRRCDLIDLQTTSRASVLNEVTLAFVSIGLGRACGIALNLISSLMFSATHDLILVVENLMSLGVHCESGLNAMNALMV